MKEVIIYLIEFTFISALFLGVYQLIKKNSTPTFRRFFLLSWVICSCVFPFISLEGFSYLVPSIPSLEENMPPTIVNSNLVVIDNDFVPPKGSHTYHNPKPKEVENTELTSRDVTPSKVFLGLYLCGVGLLLLQMLYGIYQIIRLRSRSQKQSFQNSSIYLVDKEGFLGASFFGWIFIGVELNEEKKNSIFKHEMKHRQLGHSFDVMLGHFFQAVFWFHPISWYLKKEINLTTELETDFYLVKTESVDTYGRLLLELQSFRKVAMMNHFSARNLKLRIQEMTNPKPQKKWVYALSCMLILSTFFTVSCGDLEGDAEQILPERLSELKTITTKFTSHQDDTQQKTGKVVSIATFHPDGSLDELVNKTSFPYDSEYEVKREFWDTPKKENLFYIMDGLGLGKSERNLLYGNDWGAAYLKHLRDQANSEVGNKGVYYFNYADIKADNENMPKEIFRRWTPNPKMRFNSEAPNITEYFKYDGGKIVETHYKKSFSNEGSNNEQTDPSKKNNVFDIVRGKSNDPAIKHLLKSRNENSGKVLPGTRYEFDGDFLRSVKYSNGNWGDIECRFSYVNGVLEKQEYLKNGQLIHTRIHYYKDGLKDRTEIFNIYNEPEYTIHFEYEFW